MKPIAILQHDPLQRPGYLLEFLDELAIPSQRHPPERGRRRAEVGALLQRDRPAEPDRAEFSWVATGPPDKAGPTASASPPKHVPAQNHLIELVARADRRRLLSRCEPVDLVLGQIVCEPATATRHVYFPTDGFVSLIARVSGSPGIEVGMVGREGMLGAQLALGVATSPLHAVVQGAGSALRIGKVAFRIELAHSASLRSALSATSRS